MQGEGDKFEKWIKRIPIPWDDVVGYAVAWYVSRHNPEKVKMSIHANDNNEAVGYSVRVKTEKENVQEALEFWEKYVEPKL